MSFNLEWNETTFCSGTGGHKSIRKKKYLPKNSEIDINVKEGVDVKKCWICHGITKICA